MISNLTKKHTEEVKNLQASFLSEPAIINPTIGLSVDKTAVTYFQDPICGMASYYSIIDISNAEKLAECIKELWIQSRGKIHKDLYQKISNLAMSLRPALDFQTTEISEFIYTLH